MQLYGRPVVIVVDNVDWLLRHLPAALDRLQASLISHSVLMRHYAPP